MWEIIGWVIWSVAAFVAISLAYGCRKSVKSGQGFQWGTGVQAFFFYLIAILFFIFDWNKLHIFWIAPICFFSAPLLVLGGIPILSNIVLRLTKFYLEGFILLGIKKPIDNSQQGVPDAETIFFIKGLVRSRVMNSPFTDMSYEIYDMDDFTILSLPEATLVSIVDTYQQLKIQGSLENDALEAIENHRASFGDSGILPSPLTLVNYIKYRVKLEHGNDSMSDTFIEEAIIKAIDFFRDEDFDKVL